MMTDEGLEKDERLIISIRTEIASLWPFTYLYMVTRLPNLKTTKRIRIKRNYYKRRQEFVDAYIHSYDHKTPFTLGDAYEFADTVENEYQAFKKDRRIHLG